MLTKKYPLLGSSADPEAVSLTIKGIGLAIIPVLVLVFKGLGLDITENELIEILNIIVTAVSSCMILIGLVRKLYFKLK